jgi:hypothetical protein
MPAIVLFCLYVIAVEYRLLAIGQKLYPVPVAVGCAVDEKPFLERRVSAERNETLGREAKSDQQLATPVGPIAHLLLAGFGGFRMTNIEVEARLIRAAVAGARPFVEPGLPREHLFPIDRPRPPFRQEYFLPDCRRQRCAAVL